MAITLADFNKIWASTSPLTPYSFSEAQYKEGWNFVGATPPSRQMWDFLQKQNDEKMQYLANNYLPLSGGTMTGAMTTQNVTVNGQIEVGTDHSTGGGGFIVPINQGIRFEGSTSGTTKRGRLELSGTNGEFSLTASNAEGTYKTLLGKSNGTLTWDGQPLLPVGIVQAFAGSTIPTGWLLCDGSAVSRTTYASLYACIGTTYGSGDGSTTFNLPNLTDKFIQGNGTVGTVKSAGLPNITGGMWTNGGKDSLENGAFKYTAKVGGGGTDNSNTGTGNFNFDASRSSSIYGNSTTVQPPALTMRYIIKY